MKNSLTLSFALLLLPAFLFAGGQQTSVLQDRPETWDVDYTYSPGNRPDPFVPATADPHIKIPAGAIPVRDCVLVGITNSKSGFVAIIKGPDGKARFMKERDAVWDGVIISITDDSVVFRQDTRKLDPLSPVTDREVVLKLHPLR